jgi:hypothetical protein
VGLIFKWPRKPLHCYLTDCVHLINESKHSTLRKLVFSLNKSEWDSATSLPYTIPWQKPWDSFHDMLSSSHHCSIMLYKTCTRIRLSKTILLNYENTPVAALIWENKEK